MKIAIRAAVVLAIVSFIGLVLPVTGTYDYGYNCVRCLDYEHRVQPRIFVIPVADYCMNARPSKYSKDYKEIFGTTCHHVFKTGGFGYRGGDGITAEGGVFKIRLTDLESMYEAYRRVKDRELAKRTFDLIEKYFPETTTVAGFYSRRTDADKAGLGTLWLLSRYLDLVENKDEWNQVLALPVDSPEPPSFAKDRSLLLKKLQSPSDIVRRAAGQAMEMAQE